MWFIVGLALLLSGHNAIASAAVSPCVVDDRERNDVELQRKWAVAADKFDHIYRWTKYEWQPLLVADGVEFRREDVWFVRGLHAPEGWEQVGVTAVGKIGGLAINPGSGLSNYVIQLRRTDGGKIINVVTPVRVGPLSNSMSDYDFERFISRPLFDSNKFSVVEVLQKFIDKFEAQEKLDQQNMEIGLAAEERRVAEETRQNIAEEKKRQQLLHDVMLRSQAVPFQGFDGQIVEVIGRKHKWRMAQEATVDGRKWEVYNISNIKNSLQYEGTIAVPKTGEKDFVYEGKRSAIIVRPEGGSFERQISDVLESTSRASQPLAPLPPPPNSFIKKLKEFFGG